jgi:hypothetical protein
VVIDMRQSQTAVLERGAVLADEVVTEPFEVAWATEARWFVQFLEPAPGVTAKVTAQISADGLVWVDHEAPTQTIPASGVSTLPLRDFGHWVRVVVRRGDGEGEPLVRVYLALKE